MRDFLDGAPDLKKQTNPSESMMTFMYTYDSSNAAVTVGPNQCFLTGIIIQPSEAN